jgi:hypothetical protein
MIGEKGEQEEGRIVLVDPKILSVRTIQADR